MTRKLALMIGLAALILLGPGGPARAMPIVKVQSHMQHMPKMRGPKLRPEPGKPETPAAKPGEPPPPQQFHGLMAAAQSDVRTRLGAPDVARAEGSGAMWTYSLPDCALFIFFRMPKGAPADASPRVSGAASGPRVRGQRPLPVNDCIAEAMNRQGGGAS